MNNPIANLAFPSQDGGDLKKVVHSHSLDQYLIIERGSNLVKAILYVADPLGNDYNYDNLSYCVSILLLNDETALSCINSRIRLEIEKKLAYEGISLASHRVIYSNSIYVPYDSHSFGTLPGFTTQESRGDNARWRLHIM